MTSVTPPSPDQVPPLGSEGLAPITAPEAATSTDTVRPQNVVLGGLNRLVTRWREGRIEQLQDKADELREDLAVRQNSAKRMLIPGRPHTERGPDNKIEDARVIYGYHVGSDMTEPTHEADTERIIVPSLRPVTSAQRRAAAKADKKIRSNMSRAVFNSNARLAAGLPGADGEVAVIGTPEHAEIVANARLPRSERRSHKKAARMVQRNQRIINGKVDSVRAMADGTDDVGVVIDTYITAAEEAAEKHRRMLGRRSPPPSIPTHSPARDLGPVSDSFESFSDPNRDTTKGRTRTEEAVITALNKLMAERLTVINETSLEDILKDIEDNSPALARFTLNKLRSLGIIDAEGRVLKAKSGLEEQLGTYLTADTGRDKTSETPGVIEHEPGVSLNDEQLEAAARLITQTIATYKATIGGSVSKKRGVKDIEDIEEGIIRSYIGTEAIASSEDVKKIKADVLELFERRAKLSSSTETLAQRAARKAEEKDRALKDAEEAKWAWASQEKTPGAPEPKKSAAQLAYEELQKIVPNA